jgi:hypothetical protein
MCCITSLLLVLFPRIGIVIWWFVNPLSHNLPYKNWILPSIPALIWTVLGGIFIPWTTLAYLVLYPGGITGFEWIVLGGAFLLDLASHGGTYRHRSRIHI